MNSYLDHYCERVTPQIWDEPLNVLSNLAFLLVAVLLYRHLQNAFAQFRFNAAWDLWLLVIITASIGIGSALWHLFAQEWALWADRIPIIVFISILLLSSLMRLFKLNVIHALFVLLIFQTSNILVQTTFPPPTLNGSLFYLPTLLLLTIITTILWSKNKTPANIWFMYGSLLFLLAIIFRTIDNVICDTVPVGTHFIWHILIAGTIYPLMIGLIKNSIYSNRRET